jgi:hypothetical protein
VLRRGDAADLLAVVDEDEGNNRRFVVLVPLMEASP